ncbi:hypothetical protein SAMN04488144_15011 [Methylobacterium sp. 190mf]|nr:hypothetical protein SAMN04488144_15011 [Methylobacterium sp. 190mf]
MLPGGAFIKQMRLIPGIYAVNDGPAWTAAMARPMRLGSLMVPLGRMPHCPVAETLVASHRRT